MPRGIEEHFDAYCLERSKYDIEADFAAHRIAAQVVMEFPDLVEEEHLKLRGDFVEWETADGDTVDVLGKLGYTKAQIEELEAAGVIKIG